MKLLFVLLMIIIRQIKAYEINCIQIVNQYTDREYVTVKSSLLHNEDKPQYTYKLHIDKFVLVCYEEDFYVDIYLDLNNKHKRKTYHMTEKKGISNIKNIEHFDYPDYHFYIDPELKKTIFPMIIIKDRDRDAVIPETGYNKLIH
jgi:hypothetical protein